MKSITIVRHAKAVDRNENIGDFERSLIQKGRKDSAIMAEKLAQSNYKADLIISSPADRALETAQIFADTLGYPVQKILMRDVIYDGHAMESFLYLFHELDDKHDNVMIFGHNPTLSEFAEFLLGNFNQNLPKASVVRITFEKNNWRDILPGEGRLADFDYPSKAKRQDDILDEITKKISLKVKSNIIGLLEEMDREAALNLEKKIAKSSRKIARKFVKNARNLKISR